MPMPKPKDGEDKQEFVARCMADAVMVEEYDDQKQRAAVCNTIWRDREGKTMNDSRQHIEKGARRILHIQDARLQGKQDDAAGSGWVEGYGAVWDNIDLASEIMRKGAFVKSIGERVKAGLVKLMVKHFAYGGDVMDCVGTVTEAKEDEYGLWYHADFIENDPLAANVRNKVALGHVKTNSVGFGPMSWGYVEQDGRTLIEHTECKLYEITLTVVPANELALVTAAKSIGVNDEDLMTLAAICAVDPRSPEGRAQLSTMDRGRVESLSASLEGLAGKVGGLLAAPDDAPKGVDVHAMSREIEACRCRLAVLFDL